MPRVPYRECFLFADGPDLLEPQELPDHVSLGQAVDTGRHLLLHEPERAEHMYVCGLTGSGKSRFLQNMIVQDLTCRRPLCLIDPTGGLYAKALGFVAYALQAARRAGHHPEHYLPSYLFLDLNTPANPLRVNPLEPNADESTEEQVDDLLKVSERLFGSIDEMRRLRNVLRSTFWIICELNQSPKMLQDKAVRSLIEGYGFPLNLRFASRFLILSNAQRGLLLRHLPDKPENVFAREYWTDFFSNFSKGQQAERIESSLNILQYFIGDELAARFFNTAKSTLHIPELMRQKRCLFSSIPLGRSLKGGQLIGAFLATKFQRTAYRRRKAERSPYYLYIDEFHEFGDIEFARAAANLRQYQLRLINAHQSQSQPPFHTPEGRSILETIKANSRIKTLFRLSREDAEVMIKELYELTQQEHNFTYEEKSLSLTESRSKDKTVSYQTSTSSARSIQRADSVAIARSDSYAIARSEGVNFGKTLTETFGENVTEGISSTVTRSQSETITEARSQAHGISVMIGKDWSFMENKIEGFSFGRNNSQSIARLRGLTHTATKTDSRGKTRTDGSSYKLTDAHGNTLTRNQGNVAYSQNSNEQVSSGTAMAELANQARSSGTSYSQAIQDIRTIANAIARQESQTDTQTHGSSAQTSTTTGQGQKTGGKESHTITDTDTVSQARAKMKSLAFAEGETFTIARTHQEALARSFSVLQNFCRTYTRALQKTVSQTDSIGITQEEGFSSGHGRTESEAQSTAESVAETKVFYTIEGERELRVNDLQKLPRRQAVVAKEALGAVQIEVYYIPGGYGSERDRLYRLEILRQQQQRFRPDNDAESVEPELEVPEPDDETPPDNSPFGV